MVQAIGIEESDPGPARPSLACYLDTLAELKKAQVSERKQASFMKRWSTPIDARMSHAGKHAYML